MKVKTILAIGYTSEYLGGEQSFENTLLALNKRYNIVLLNPKGILTERLKDKIIVIEVKGISQLKRTQNKYWAITLFKTILISFFELQSIIRKVKPVLIHCYSEISLFYVGLLSKIFRKKVIVQMGNIIPPKKLWVFLSRLLGIFVDHHVGASQAVRLRLIDVGHDPNKIKVLYGNISSDFFLTNRIKQGEFRNAYGINNNEIVFGIIGSTYYLKGQHIFIKAANYVIKNSVDINNVRFVVVGGPRNDTDLDYLRFLKKLVSNLGLEEFFIFTGHLEHSKIPDVLCDLNVATICSVLPDALPRTVLEAMAMRKIVLASNTGGIPEVVKPGSTGFLYKPGDAEELGDKMQYVLENFSKLENIGENARAIIESKFSPNAFQRDLLQLYDSFIHSS